MWLRAGIRVNGAMKHKDAMSGLTPLEEAQKIVLDSTPVLGLEKIPLLDALGRVLGEVI